MNHFCCKNSNTAARKYFTSIIIIGVFLFSSCASKRETVYLNDLSDTIPSQTIQMSKFTEPIIQKDDILSISIETISPSATSANLQTAGSSSTSPTSTQPNTSGYLVDNNGEVQLPMIGKLKLTGLTTSQAKSLILEKAAFYLKDPIVQVRFVNFKITVIGEVNKPATYTVTSEKVSIFDALGMAGDLTIFGKRENVTLIRDNEGSKDIIRLNLASSNFVKSPYFFLKQNDVLYIQPNDAKIASNNSARRQILTTAISVISVIVLLITRL
jgi:polysaccharide export outer membrane protein